MKDFILTLFLKPGASHSIGKDQHCVYPNAYSAETYTPYLSMPKAVKGPISDLVGFISSLSYVQSSYNASSLNGSLAERPLVPIVIHSNIKLAQDWALWSCVFFVYYLFIAAFVKTRTALIFRRFTRQNGCLPMRVAPNPFGGKLRRYFEFSKVNANILDDYLLAKFQKNGWTHGLASAWTGRIKGIATVEADNFQSVLSTNFDDWERPAFRAKAIKPLLGPGILTLVILTKVHNVARLMILRMVHRGPIPESSSSPNSQGNVSMIT